MQETLCRTALTKLLKSKQVNFVRVWTRISTEKANMTTTIRVTKADAIWTLETMFTEFDQINFTRDTNLLGETGILIGQYPR